MYLHEREMESIKLLSELEYQTLKLIPDEFTYDQIFEIYGISILTLTAHFNKEERDHSIKNELYNIATFIHNFVVDNKMTYGEAMKAIGSMVSSSAKYLIRIERHPEDHSKPGGLA